MTNLSLRRLARPLCAALAFPVCLLAQTADDRENDTPTATYWASGRTPADVTALINQGYRLTNLQIDGTNPWTFTVAMAPNSGAYGIGTWWYYGIDAAGVSSALQQNNARLIDLEPYDNGAGATRFACVMVSNAGANAKGWDWLYDTTTTSIASLTAQGKRIVDLEEYTVGGQTRYACVTVDNAGADARSWWYYYGVSQATLASLLSQNGARVYDLDRAGSAYNVVMIGQAGQPKNWRYYGLTGAQVTDTLSQIGARLIDVDRYFTINGYRYDVVMVNNSNALSTRLSELLRGNTDGHGGVFLKRANGAELAYINGDRPHEPASTLKTLHLLEAMRQVQIGTTTLASTYRTYTAGGPLSCPTGSGAYVDESLTSTLNAMMQVSDNLRTRTVTDNFGGFAQLNSRAGVLGMASTQVNHHIGCGLPANATTLRDIGRIHEQVVAGYLGNQRDAFYARMSQNYQGGGFAGGRVGVVINEEANSIGVSSAQRAAFLEGFQIRWKGGSYDVNNRFFHSWGAYVAIPFVVGNAIQTREYVLGSFVADATVESQAINTINLAASEALRDELRAALQSWSTVTAASTTAIGTGCGSPVATQSALGLPRLGTQVGYAMNNAYPSSPAVFAVGFSNTSANGVPLPFNLALIGSLPGCTAYNDLAITSAQIANLSGLAISYLAIPNDITFAGFTYYTQWYSFDALGGQAFKTSNGRRSVVGL